MPLQTQAGTKLTGYAISYGFDDDTLLPGSSPEVIGQGVVAGHEAKGLVAEPTFRAVMAALPEDPSFARGPAAGDRGAALTMYPWPMPG
jgi:hypothetical protein